MMVITLLFSCWWSNIEGATLSYETSPAHLFNQLLESQICDGMPHLPACAALNQTLQLESRSDQMVDLFPANHLVTLALDYVAATQRMNTVLRNREVEQVAEIAKLERDKEHLGHQVRSLEKDWLPLIDKYPGTRIRSGVANTLSSSQDTTYTPTANILRPVDCSDYLLLGAYKSGVYEIYPFKCRCSEPVKVWCDMETDGGGWTLFLKRQNSSDNVSFTKSWKEYKQGFGNASTEYWIGNDILHIMTSTRAYIMRFDFQQRDGSSRWGEWNKFVVANEANRYKLDIPTFNALSMTTNCMAHHNGKYFSTYDYDNDGTSSQNCAVAKSSGWWYYNCATLDPTIPFNADGNLNTSCTYKLNGKSLRLEGPSLQLKIRPQICSQLIKAVEFNSHSCKGHNES